MTTLINARPRFGLEGDRLFCYLTSRYYAAVGAMEDGIGVWDLQKVAELIRGGAPIESAFLVGDRLDLQHQLDSYAAENEKLKAANESLNAQLAATMEALDAAMNKISQQDDLKETPQPDKVEQAAADFNAATPAPAEGDKVEQAKTDFLNDPRERLVASDPASPDGDHGATVIAEKQADGSLKILDVQIEPRADVEGAMAAQEAPPKGD